MCLQHREGLVFVRQSCQGEHFQQRTRTGRWSGARVWVDRSQGSFGGRLGSQARPSGREHEFWPSSSSIGKVWTIPREAQLDKVTGSGTRCAFKGPCCPQRRLLILQIRPNLSDDLLLILPSSFHYLDRAVKIKSCRLSNSDFLIGMADTPIPCWCLKIPCNPGWTLPLPPPG